MGSCVPLQFMSAALAPHCWNATSFADPEYVMDFGSPKAFCALAITVFASCAMALPHRNAAQIAATEIFLSTASPLPEHSIPWHMHPCGQGSCRLALPDLHRTVLQYTIQK